MEVLLVLLAYLCSQRTEICCFGGVPLHILLPWRDAELYGDKKICAGPDITWENEHWCGQDETHKTQTMSS